MIYLLLFIIAVPAIFALTGIYISAPRYQGAVSDHFDGKKFINPGGIEAKGPKEVLQWMLNRNRGPWVENIEPQQGSHPIGREKEQIRITFVNHSSFLLQLAGLNILTDPIWSKRTSPFSWIGPKRMRVPGLEFEDLPRIDAVLISHNHYDHLDLPTLRVISGSFHPRIFTPLGVKKFLDDENISGAADLDWWDEIAINDSVSIQAVPAQHFSGRGIRDRDATLWCGYVLKTPRGNIYFAGDTGYNENTFREIGERCKEIKVALLPIGAYKPEWFMSAIHTSPEQAVKIHLDVGAEVSIGMHFGTFPLADDGMEDPVNDLKIALAKHQVNEDRFVVLKEGQPFIVE